MYYIGLMPTAIYEIMMAGVITLPHWRSFTSRFRRRLSIVACGIASMQHLVTVFTADSFTKNDEIRVICVDVIAVLLCFGAYVRKRPFW